ncbi:hypothetical protein LINGRAHAP2_LOCUS9079 [Linum grandiflorum]
MSWLARSIANSLKLDDDDTDGNDDHNDSKSPPTADSDQHSPSSAASSTTTTPRGVKEDISEITKTLSRQFWGVASFLAPPPESAPPPPQISEESSGERENRQLLEGDESDDALIEGIRSDFAEIGGRFKSGIEKLSSNKAVSEITKIASNFLQFASEGDLNDEDLIGTAVGVTEEAVAFARDVSVHPETWIDFPVPDVDDFEDFDMSDAQQEHALTVERLAPRLAALRIELCPGYMSEGCFWKIYFVLLHPRLSKEDALLLSTPQIMEARAMLSQELQRRAKAKPSSILSETNAAESTEAADPWREQSLSVPSHTESAAAAAKNPLTTDVVGGAEKDKHAIQSADVEIVDKAVVVQEETISPQIKHHSPSASSSANVTVNQKLEEEDEDDDGDDWLKDETSETVGASGTNKHVDHDDDEDVSFSDLEEDDDEGDVPVSYKKVTSEKKESNDWLDVEDIDVL